MEDILLYDRSGDPRSQYWYKRYILRKEFGLSAAEIDTEPNQEAMVHLKIVELIGERQNKEQEEAERRSERQRQSRS